MKCLKPLLIDYNIHQKVLCGIYLNLLCIIEQIVTKVIIICSGLNYYLFCELLSKIENEYSDLPYHLLAVWWLNSNKSSVSFWAQDGDWNFS